MSILSGYKKVKNYIETGSGKKLLSRWTSSNTVEFNDGKTAEEKLGNIKGITSDLTKTTNGYALDATAGTKLNQSLEKFKIREDNKFNYTPDFIPVAQIGNWITNGKYDAQGMAKAYKNDTLYILNCFIPSDSSSNTLVTVHTTDETKNKALVAQKKLTGNFYCGHANSATYIESLDKWAIVTDSENTSLHRVILLNFDLSSVEMVQLTMSAWGISYDKKLDAIWIASSNNKIYLYDKYLKNIKKTIILNTDKNTLTGQSMTVDDNFFYFARSSKNDIKINKINIFNKETGSFYDEVPIGLEVEVEDIEILNDGYFLMNYNINKSTIITKNRIYKKNSILSPFYEEINDSNIIIKKTRELQLYLDNTKNNFIIKNTPDKPFYNWWALQSFYNLSSYSNVTINVTGDFSSCDIVLRTANISKITFNGTVGKCKFKNFSCTDNIWIVVNGIEFCGSADNGIELRNVGYCYLNNIVLSGNFKTGLNIIGSNCDMGSNFSFNGTITTGMTVSIGGTLSTNGLTIVKAPTTLYNAITGNIIIREAVKTNNFTVANNIQSNINVGSKILIGENISGRNRSNYIVKGVYDIPSSSRITDLPSDFPASSGLTLYVDYCTNDIAIIKLVSHIPSDIALGNYWVCTYSVKNKTFSAWYKK